MMTTPITSSVYGTAEAEYTIKKSRFIASLQEIHTESDATNFIEKVKKQYWDAKHHCYAWQLGPTGQQQKSNDDGEPAGTAGRPILEVLKKSAITNTVIVVTRYFGGIKLGASGLIRAYSHTAALGLDTAVIADYKAYIEVRITFDYSFMNSLERLIPMHHVLVADRTFLQAVTFLLHVPEEGLSPFHQTVMDATNGSIVWEEGTTITIPIIRNNQK